MHPLSIFPRLLDFIFVAPLLLRLAVGLLMIYLGKERHKKTYKWSCFIYAISGALLILGLYTQPASILAILTLGFDFYVEKKNSTISKESMVLYIIVGVILLSLLLTGPGAFAFDLPL